MERNPNPDEINPADDSLEVQPTVNGVSLAEDDFYAQVDPNAVIVEGNDAEGMDKAEIPDVESEDGALQPETESLPENSEDTGKMVDAAPAPNEPRRRYRNSFNYEHRNMNLAATEQAAADAAHNAKVQNRQENASAIGEIYTAMQHRVILKGVVAAVSDDGENAFFVVYMANKVEVRIPFAEVFAVPPADLLNPNTNQKLRRQCQLLRKSIGAELQFIVTDVKEQDGWVCATASRVRALRSLIYRYFLQPGRATQINVGDTLEADILAVAPYAVYVCVCGIDIRIENRNLTHKFCSDLKNSYHAGDRIKVKVMALDVSETTINLEVSGREAELDQLRGNLDRITRLLKNSRPSVIATVTSLTIHRTNGKPKCVASLYLDSLDLPAFTSVFQSDMGDRYISGDKVIFEAHGVTERGYVFGSITRHLGRK